MDYTNNDKSPQVKQKRPFQKQKNRKFEPDNQREHFGKNKFNKKRKNDTSNFNRDRRPIGRQFHR